MKTLRNFNILESKLRIVKDLKDKFQDKSLSECVNTVDKLIDYVKCTDGVVSENDFDSEIFYWICISRCFQFNFEECDDFDPHETEIVNNELVNSLGLSADEMWFNTLSEQEKKYCIQLAKNTFFTPPAQA